MPAIGVIFAIARVAGLRNAAAQSVSGTYGPDRDLTLM
jgi:hypothetical protein